MKSNKITKPRKTGKPVPGHPSTETKPLGPQK